MEPTNTSLTNATKTVTPASVASARLMGHAASCSSAELANNSRCVLSENQRPRPYASKSKNESATLRVLVEPLTPNESRADTADGLRSAIVAGKSEPDWNRAATLLNS